MKLAFCLFDYFPYGGLQRDFLHIAKVCEQRGHEIHVYTMSLEGELPSSFCVHLLKKRGWQNHQRCFDFTQQLFSHLSRVSYDVVIGFNKMPHLDIYYAADVCYEARVKASRSFLYRLLPRYRHLLALEKAVFAPGSKTEILLIAELQGKEYSAFYQTESERFHLLPPGIAKDRIAPPNAADIRKRVRFANHIADDDILLLMVGSGFKTKGLDRAINSIASLPTTIKERCHFFVIGQDHPDSFIKLARKQQVSDRITFLGGRKDVPDFLLAADLLLHPAYHENTGTVLLEAMLSGLPVLTVDVCGYAHYVSEAKAGIVLSSPFCQNAWDTTLQEMLLSQTYHLWQQNGLAFSQYADIYNMSDRAADFIEQAGRKT